ncbi:MAG: hypothetical protein J7484_01030 [Microbacterium sp.]|nr:hypothetical protein [Microbacterium sp.]
MTRSPSVLQRALRSAGHGIRAALDPSTAPLWIAAIAVLGIALPFIALGGLGPAHRDPAQATAGDEVRTALYAVTLVDAELTDEVEEQYLKADQGEQLFVVTVVLENLTSVPVGVLQTVDRVRSRLVGSRTPLLDLSGVAATEDPYVWRDESLAAVVLQPHVPAEVHIAWRVPEGSFSGGSAVLDVYDAAPQAGQVILSSSAVTWRRTEKAAQVSTAVSP